MRAGDLVALTIDDVNIDTGEVWVRSGKGQKQRTCYIGRQNPQTTETICLQPWHGVGRGTAVCLENTGESLTVSGIVQMMKRLSQRSSVRNCTAHTFRRTFALTCLRNGMNIYVLARLMGHSDITVLRQYLALAEVDLQKAHKEFGRWIGCWGSRPEVQRPPITYSEQYILPIRGSRSR